MKSNILSIVVVIIFILSACEGSEGPAGAKGEIGPVGPAGKNGVANTYTETFTISTSNSTSNSDGSIVINSLSIPEITQQVYDEGIVKVETGLLANGWTGMPFSLTVQGISLSINYSYQEGQIHIVHIYPSGGITEDLIQEGPYKITVIPPSKEKTKASTASHRIENMDILK